MQTLSPALARKIAATIADEIGARPAQVEAAVALLEEGATVPSVARYPKEVTGGLEDTQLRNLDKRLTSPHYLQHRRHALLTPTAQQVSVHDGTRHTTQITHTKSRTDT